MIFEQAYGEWLCSELDKELQKINDSLATKRYDEIMYKALVDNRNEVAVMFSGGNASMSAVEGLDQNTMPLSITIMCEDKNKTAVRNAIANLQKQYNAAPMTLRFYDAAAGANVSVRTKSTFNTPFVLDERDYRTNTATIKATVIQMSVSVIYGQNAVISPATLVLGIDGKELPINGILAYNRASKPAYDEFLSEGYAWTRRNLLAKGLTYSITIAKSDGDTLFDMLDSDLLTATLADKTLWLRVNGNVIPITGYDLTESYQDNAAAYTLNLWR